MKVRPSSLCFAILLTLAPAPAAAKCPGPGNTAPMSLGFGSSDIVAPPSKVFLMFWGFGTYGDPTTFATAYGIPESVSSAARDVFPWRSGSDSSFGIGGTKWTVVPFQYYGFDYTSGSFLTHIPNSSGQYGGAISNEAGLPSPVNGVVTISDQVVKDLIDKVAWPWFNPPSQDDVILVVLPKGTRPSITVNSSAPAKHFVTDAGHLGGGIPPWD